MPVLLRKQSRRMSRNGGKERGIGKNRKKGQLEGK
jgi:hypothetical protein